MNNTKEAIIKTNSKKFFNYWLLLTKPLHKLKPIEVNVLALLLYYYFEFKKEIKNDSIAWKLVFEHDIKLKIKNELNIKCDQSITNVIYKLRKKNIIINNTVNKSFIPNIDDKTSLLVFKFEIND